MVSSSHFRYLGLDQAPQKKILKKFGRLRLKRTVFGPLLFPSLSVVLWWPGT